MSPPPDVIPPVVNSAKEGAPHWLARPAPPRSRPHTSTSLAERIPNARWFWRRQRPPLGSSRYGNELESSREPQAAYPVPRPGLCGHSCRICLRVTASSEFAPMSVGEERDHRDGCRFCPRQPSYSASNMTEHDKFNRIARGQRVGTSARLAR